MKFLKFRRRTWVLLAVLVAAAVAAVSGYAYFSGSGGGTGTAYIGSAGPITVTPSWPAGQYLYPGGPTINVPLLLTNTSGNSSAYVGAISGSVATVGSCLGSWFTVTATTYGGTIAPLGTGNTTGHVTMIDDGLPDQNACQGGTPTVTWTVP